MKSKQPQAQVQKEAESRAGVYGAVAAAVVALFAAYSPVMHAPFVFDDTMQIFALSNGSESIGAWVKTLIRPLLMSTYWFNAQLSREDTFSYHVLNLLIHATCAGMVWLILRRLMEWAGIDGRRRELLSGLGAGLFLLHPAQTEAVAYIAGRSESLSGMFSAAALAAFLYRKEAAITWPRTALVVVLSVAAMMSKEQAVVLFAVFLLTDFWWNPGFSLKGAVSNWKLYAPMIAGAVGAVALLYKLILGVGTGGSAGFSMKEFTWYQYLFTQFRGIWVYIANFLFPANLNLDWDFTISRSLFDHGAIFGLIGLAGLAVAAWVMRRRFPLAGYGYFLFLLLLAPTSSILPIKDAVADRRLYLPMLGLLCIAIDFLSRLRLERKVLAMTGAVVLVLAAAGTYARASVWSDPVTLWEDTVKKSPNKARTHFQLGFVYYQQQRYDLAVPELEKAASLDKPDYNLLVDLGLAYDGLHQFAKALEKLQAAAALEQTAHVYTQIGKVYAEQNRWQEAMAAFDRAQLLDARFPAVYAYKGLVHMATGDVAGSIPLFQQALSIDPMFQPAIDGIRQAQQRLAAPR